jgi:hypothetical protein
MMNIYKVLEILNNGEYVKLEERHTSSDLCPYSESSYKVTLKEGGMIRITQVRALGVTYRISLFVPNEEKSVESWLFQKHREGWLHRKTIKDPLYDEVKSTFYNLYYEYSKKKLDERSKYFPQ